VANVVVSIKKGVIMGRVIIYLVIAVFMTFMVGGQAAIAKEKNKGQGDRPSGWEQGEKTGWDDDSPPGLHKKADDDEMKEKKDKKKKDKKKKDKKKKMKKKKGDQDDEGVKKDDGEDDDGEKMKKEDEDEDEGGDKEMKNEDNGGGEDNGVEGAEESGDEDRSGEKQERGKKRGFFKRFFGGEE